MFNAKIVDLGTLGYYTNQLRGILSKLINKKNSKVDTTSHFFRCIKSGNTHNK